MKVRYQDFLYGRWWTTQAAAVQCSSLSELGHSAALSAKQSRRWVLARPLHHRRYLHCMGRCQRAGSRRWSAVMCRTVTRVMSWRGVWTMPSVWSICWWIGSSFLRPPLSCSLAFEAFIVNAWMVILRSHQQELSALFGSGTKKPKTLHENFINEEYAI